MDDIKKDLDAAGILTITLNRPEKLNALSGEVLDALEKLLLEAEQNDAVKALLITGEGKAFSAGADISELQACTKETGQIFAERGQRVFRRLESGKPSLAAVNGYAFGGGCELALSATFRMAADHAKFGQPELKLGVIPGFGGTQRLARLVGPGRALDLILSGRFIGAEEALHFGLVSAVVPQASLLETAKQYLQSVISMAPLALRLTRKAIEEGLDMPLKEALQFEANLFAKACGTEDKNEGVSAFLEKRAAQFRGR